MRCYGAQILISTRVVYWNDANGSTFVLAKIGNEMFENHDIIVEDCTVRTFIILRQSFIIAILIASKNYHHLTTKFYYWDTYCQFVSKVSIVRLPCCLKGRSCNLKLETFDTLAML